MTGLGLTSYGVCIPRPRIAVEETLRLWRNIFAEILREQLMLSERVVLPPDQDAVTMAVDAGRQALARWGRPFNQIDALYFGTCTNPYEARPSATILAEAFGENPWLTCADVQFSTKSGVAALQIAHAMVASGSARAAMAVGSDAMNRHAAPGTLQEYAASAAASAFIVGSGPDVIAELGPFTAVVSDLSDGFRVSGERYLRSGGIATQESGIGFLEHMAGAVRRHFERTGATARDFDAVVIQQPLGVVPFAVARRLGFSMAQVSGSLTAYELGDTGSASVGLGLSLVLDSASPGDRILLVAYGFGAGALVTDLRVTDRIVDFPRQSGSVERQMQRKQLVDYATAAKFEGKFAKVPHAHTAWS